MKKTLSIFLALVLCATTASMGAYAKDEAGNDKPVVVTEAIAENTKKDIAINDSQNETQKATNPENNKIKEEVKAQTKEAVSDKKLKLKKGLKITGATCGITALVAIVTGIVVKCHKLWKTHKIVKIANKVTASGNVANN